jgi:hypothetical protein
MRKLDRCTVKTVELTAPGACRRDADLLQSEMKTGRIFGAFTKQERESIWEELCAVSTYRLIPSLFTFFEDAKYLHGPAECVKQLMDVSNNDHTPRTLKHSFSGANQKEGICMFQVSESQLEARPGNVDDQLDLGYRQVWMTALQSYYDMPSQHTKAS